MDDRETGVCLQTQQWRCRRQGAAARLRLIRGRPHQRSISAASAPKRQISNLPLAAPCLPIDGLLGREAGRRQKRADCGALVEGERFGQGSRVRGGDERVRGVRSSDTAAAAGPATGGSESESESGKWGEWRGARRIRPRRLARVTSELHFGCSVGREERLGVG